MADTYAINMKPAFFSAVSKLSPKEALQINNKVLQLIADPRPDAKVKKQLKYLHGVQHLHRLRSGSYRIFYTFDQHTINILALRRRDDDTYEDDLDAEFLAGLPIDPSIDPSPEKGYTFKQPDWESWLKPPLPESRLLPEPITIELLTQLSIPENDQPRLLEIKDEDALLSCPGVESKYLERVIEHLFEPPMRDVVRQSNFILNDPDDLLRYRNGDLLGFLLKLSPDQEKYVEWAIDGAGPTLVKGGPGTGKSTIALYRVQALLAKMRKAGQSAPRILFSTYTNALVNSSRQLLEQLLGPAAAHVQVSTSDKIIYELLTSLQQHKTLIKDSELHHILQEVIAGLRFEGNMLQQQSQRQLLTKMGQGDLLQEIREVIIARQVPTLEAYLSVLRAGRQMRLTGSQRRVVWRVYEQLRNKLSAENKETWQQFRARAASLIQNSSLCHSYDAVVIDEAQDLDPGALRVLIDLCKTPNRIFVTADANQSIYGSGFNWSDVHTSLRFQGRTSILRANYRSTREIGEAAQSYLASGQLEPPSSERHYINEGPLPDARTIETREEELHLLENFFRKAILHLRLTLSSCALLCPNEAIGRDLAHKLAQRDLDTTFMRGRDLDLARPGVKILTLKSAKGLEFPIVALAGFLGSDYPTFPADASEEEREEILARERRTLFVGMTRAMRALIILIPAHTSTPLLQGFVSQYWNSPRPLLP